MTTREQRIEAVAEQYEPAPAPRYSDRELSRQLAVAQTALGRVQIERNRLEAELADAMLKLRQSEQRAARHFSAINKWSSSYPDLGDPHDKHERGRFQGDCQACADELALLLLSEQWSYEKHLSEKVAA